MKINIKVDKLHPNGLKSAFPESMQDGKVRLIKQWVKSKDSSHGQRTAVINVTHGLHVKWAATIENLFQKNTKDFLRKDFVKVLEEMSAREENERLHEDSYITITRDILK